MNLGLDGKNALITGSTKGIGKAIATLLHKEGCNVTINGRDSKTLSDTVSLFKERIHGCVADVTDPNDCKTLIKETINQWGSIDVLVCNVGDGASVPPGKETLDEWKQILDKNFYSTVNIIDSAKDELSKTQGSIVCVSSMTGMETIGAPITYSVAKSALNAYVKNLSKPLAKLGVRINAVAPGNVLFEGSVWEKKLSENPSNVQNLLKNDVALGRFGKPEEIVNFVVFLASETASFATGALFVVDGGQTRS